MRVGERVELHPGCDAWARGDRFGEVVAVVERTGRVLTVQVKMDRSGRVLRLLPARVRVVGREYHEREES